MTFQGLGFWLVAIPVMIILVGILVLGHELGHFITARLARMRVLEFGIGFPPKAKVLGHDRHGTEYTLNYLPIGGFVRLEGEESNSDDPEAFVNSGIVKQVIVLAAGVAMNLVIAFVLFFVVALLWNPTVGLKASYIMSGGAAERAGLPAGATIESIDGQRFGFLSTEDVLTAIRARPGETVTIGYVDLDGSHKTLDATLANNNGTGQLGISCSEGAKTSCTWDQVIMYGHQDPITAIGTAAGQTGLSLRLVLDGLGGLASSFFNHPAQAPAGVAGPVGITEGVGNVLFGYGPILLLLLAAVLSANLALVNVLPFPPLDGGKIAIMVAKRVAGKRGVSAVEAASYMVGFVLLMAFIAWISFFDIARLIGGS